MSTPLPVISSLTPLSSSSSVDSSSSSSSSSPLSQSTIYSTSVSSFLHYLSVAEHYISQGHLKQSANLLLFCLEQYRHTNRHDLLARVLSLLGEIAFKNELFEQANQYRQAEKLIYETSLLHYALKEEEIMTQKKKGEYIPEEQSEQKEGVSVSASSLPLTSVDPAFISSLSSNTAPNSLQSDERRALSYEKLAQLFFNEKNLVMSKEYAMKAIQLRSLMKEKYEINENMNKEEREAKEMELAGKELYEESLKQYKKQQKQNDAQDLSSVDEFPSDANANQKYFLSDQHNEQEQPRLFQLNQTLMTIDGIQKKKKKEEQKQPSNDQKTSSSISTSSSSSPTEDELVASLLKKYSAEELEAKIKSMSKKKPKPFNTRAFLISSSIGLVLFSIFLYYFLNYYLLITNGRRRRQ